MAEIGPTGSVCFVNSPFASVHVVMDQLGSISGDVFTPAGAGTPVRLVDTRDGSIVSPGLRVCVAAVGPVGDVAVVNITPVEATGPGNGLLVSSDVVVAPVAASVNFDVGSVNPNLAVARIGADGEVCFVNSPRSSVHVVMDQIGSIAASSFEMASTDGSPVRIVDTRGGPIVGPGGRVCAEVSGSTGDVAMVNITPVGATGRGNGLLVASYVSEPPIAANVNYSVGSVDPNVAVADIAPDGEVCFVNSALASVHVVMDQMGSLTGDDFAWWGLQAPVRIADTRNSLPPFPPPSGELSQGGFIWAAVLAGGGTPTAPSLVAAIAAARAAGYSTGPTDCDVGAADALGLPPGTLTVSIYFATEAEAIVARAAFVARGVDAEVAEVQTFCLD